MRCKFVQIGDRYYCPVCDPSKQRTQKRVSWRNCITDPPGDLESELQAAGVVPGRHATTELWSSWRIAVARWRDAGKPVRSDAEMDACLSVCRTCEHYDTRAGLLGYCRVCGCNVSRIAIGPLNKIRMATETCPKAKWE